MVEHLKLDYLILWIFVTVLSEAILGTAHVHPKQQEVRVGRTATVICSSDVEGPVDWRFKVYNEPHEHDIVTRGRPVNGFAAKYKTMDVGKQHLLVIKNIQISDSGRYACVDDAGFGEPAYAQLKATTYDEAVWFTVSPNEIVTDIGARLLLVCSTSAAGPVDWRFRLENEQHEHDIVTRGQPVNGLRRKFEVDVVGEGQHLLIIKNVTRDDSGYFKCVDDGGFGNSATSHVRVTADPDIATHPTATPALHIRTAVVTVVDDKLGNVDNVKVVFISVSIPLAVAAIIAGVVFILIRRQLRQRRLTKAHDHGSDNQETESFNNSNNSAEKA